MGQVERALLGSVKMWKAAGIQLEKPKMLKALIGILPQKSFKKTPRPCREFHKREKEEGQDQDQTKLVSFHYSFMAYHQPLAPNKRRVSRVLKWEATLTSPEGGNDG